jgi:hypothetical protein
MSQEPETNDQTLDREIDSALRAALAALPRSIEPRRDLWPEIARRVRAPRRRVWMERLAAGLLVALAVAFVLRQTGSPPSTPTPEAPAPPALVPPSPVVLSAYGETDRALIEVRDELRRVVEEQAKGLSPETRRLVFENLATIERAMAEIEAAMAKEPAGPERESLGRTYISYRQRQIDLLRQVNRAAARL